MPWLLMTWWHKEPGHHSHGIELVPQEYSGFCTTFEMPWKEDISNILVSIVAADGLAP